MPDRYEKLQKLVNENKLLWELQEILKQTWEEKYNLLVAYANIHNQCELPRNAVIVTSDENGITKEIKLGYWLLMQKTAKKNLKLKIEREIKLQMLVDDHKMTWEINTLPNIYSMNPTSTPQQQQQQHQQQQQQQQQQQLQIQQQHNNQQDQQQNSSQSSMNDMMNLNMNMVAYWNQQRFYPPPGTQHSQQVVGAGIYGLSYHLDENLQVDENDLISSDDEEEEDDDDDDDDDEYEYGKDNNKASQNHENESQIPSHMMNINNHSHGQQSFTGSTVATFKEVAYVTDSQVSSPNLSSNLHEQSNNEIGIITEFPQNIISNELEDNILFERMTNHDDNPRKRQKQ